jgi:glycosyltransferase involved in cell wall biosynthesis
MREVCLVIPCYNEAERLRGDLVLDFLEARDLASLCFVNDGSSDGTLKVLETLRMRGPERIMVLNLARNSGKAEAVRQGVAHAVALRRFAFIGYWDADLSTPLSELDGLLAAFDINPGCLLAMGSRIKRLGSDIERNAARHYLGRIFSTFASQVLRLPVYDSQCGAKVFRSELTGVLFGDRFITRWLFDVEMLARLRNHLGREALLEAAIEVPLTAWREMGGSKLRMTHIVRVPFELLKILSHYDSHLPSR